MGPLGERNKTLTSIVLLSRMPAPKSWTSRQFPEGVCHYCGRPVTTTNLDRKKNHLRTCPKFAERIGKQDAAGQQIPSDILEHFNDVPWVGSQFRSGFCTHCHEKVPVSNQERRTAHLKDCSNFARYLQALRQQGSTTGLQQIPKDILRHLGVDSHALQDGLHDSLQIMPTTSTTPIPFSTHIRRRGEVHDSSSSHCVLSDSSADVHYDLSLTTDPSPQPMQDMNSTVVERPTLHPEPWDSTDFSQEMQSMRCGIRRPLR